MWRDLSVTTLPTPINAYEQYKPLNGNGIISGGGGGGKWNQPGNRSSYSLPHPAHVQSNQRWQHYSAEPPPPHHMQQRPLSHSPSYQHIPSSVVSNGIGPGGNHPHHQVRSRPVSMYDMPSYASQQPHSFSSFMAAAPPPPPSAASKMMMQNAKHHHQYQQQQQHHHHQQPHHHHSNGNLAESKGGGGGGNSIHMRQKPGELVRYTKINIIKIQIKFRIMNCLLRLHQPAKRLLYHFVFALLVINL